MMGKQEQAEVVEVRDPEVESYLVFKTGRSDPAGSRRSRGEYRYYLAVIEATSAEDAIAQYRAARPGIAQCLRADAPRQIFAERLEAIPLTSRELEEPDPRTLQPTGRWMEVVDPENPSAGMMSKVLEARWRWDAGDYDWVALEYKHYTDPGDCVEAVPF